MGAAKQPYCRYCKARLQWRRTFRGELISLDAEPVEGGKFVVRENIALLVRHPLKGERLYKPHWASCPGAQQAREAAQAKRQLRMFD